MKQFNHEFEDTKNSDTLLLHSTIGVMTERKLKLFCPIEREMLLNEIAFLELKSKRNYNYNYLIGSIGLVFFVMGFVVDISYFLFVGLLLLSFSLFFKNSKFYILIVLKNPKKIFIKLNKKDITDIRIFIRKVNEFIR